MTNVYPIRSGTPQPNHWSRELGAPSGAWISDCRTYRTLLWRTFAIEGNCTPLVFCMLNPSTADAFTDDPTIVRCLGFAQREGAGGIIVVNLSPYRTSSPAELNRAYRADTDVILATLNQEAWSYARKYGSFVLAWGASVPSWADGIARLARRLAAPGICLGKTKMGEPRHPLFVRKDAPLLSMTGERIY